MFLVGYAGTWVVKWLLVALVLGPEVTFQNIAQEIGIWTTSREQVMNADNAYTGEGWYAMALWLRTNFTWLYALLANAGTVIYGNVAGMLSVLATVACMVAAIITRIKSKRPFGAWFWCAIAAAGVPLAYFVLMANHAATHRVVFGYKNWALTMGVVACMSVLYCQAVQPGRSKSKSS